MQVYIRSRTENPYDVCTTPEFTLEIEKGDIEKQAGVSQEIAKLIMYQLYSADELVDLKVGTHIHTSKKKRNR